MACKEDKADKPVHHAVYQKMQDTVAQITVLAFVHASGDVLDPWTIFPGQYV